MIKRIHGLSVDLLSNPGETLQEVLESNGMTQKELAARISVSAKYINQIITGTVGITTELAFKLAKIFNNIPATFWINLQAQYDEAKKRIL